MKGIEDLYVAATAASPIFAVILKDDIVAAIGEDIFPDARSHIKVAPLKDKVRAAEKAKDDYGKRADGPGDAWLYDIVRGAVMCSTQEQICAIVAALHSHPRVQVVRLKNRFKNPTPSGFRDININLRVEIGPGGSGVYHVCELQIHLAAIYDFNNEHHSHHQNKRLSARQGLKKKPQRRKSERRRIVRWLLRTAAMSSIRQSSFPKPSQHMMKLFLSIPPI